MYSHGQLPSENKLSRCASTQRFDPWASSHRLASSHSPFRRAPGFSIRLWVKHPHRPLTESCQNSQTPRLGGKVAISTGLAPNRQSTSYSLPCTSTNTVLKRESQASRRGASGNLSISLSVLEAG